VTSRPWTCPSCGARLVGRNLSHACGDYSVAGFLEGKGKRAHELFDRFERMIARCGPYSRAPAKTRVAFMADVRFASVNRVTDATIDVHFVLPRVVASPRFRRVEHLGKLHVHHVRLSEPADFERELQRWLRESYREYGRRQWLEAKG
jgi:hypothetical protein